MRIFLLAVSLFSSSLSFGSADQDPRPQMHEMAKEVTALQKFMLTDVSFGLPANEGAIKKSMSSLTNHLDHLSKESFASDPALKANLGLLKSHVQDAARAFENGSKPFSRYMLQSSMQMCIACHTRRKAGDFSWPEPDVAGMSALDRADYYFATRQFSKGVEIYKALVKNYPENNRSSWDARKAALNLAVYYARVSDDPRSGAEYFSKTAQNKELPVYLQQEMTAWAKEFLDWAKEAPKNNSKDTETQLLTKAKKLLRHDDFTLLSELGRSFHVRRLRASVLLHRVLEAPGEKSPAKAEALLFLGQIYPHISSNIFFRFGEMYLKACIQDYPKTAAARSCYTALELVVTEGFTGSGGTSIPEADEVELMRLKRLAY